MRSSQFMKFLSVTLFALSPWLLAPAASAAGDKVSDGDGGGALHGLTTASHFGYAVVDKSTTGFADVGGSLAFLDVTKDGGHGFGFGLRTTGQGGRLHSRQFYRLGAGPLLTWRFAANWRAELAMSFFQESGLAADGQAAYRSRGTAEQLGWERVFTLGSRVELAWGGFIERHEGALDPMAPKTAAVAAPYAGTSTNVGLSHGLEMALRVRL